MNKFGIKRKTKEQRQQEDLASITEFLDGVPVEAMMCAVIESLRKRQDFDASKLTANSHEIARMAWAKLKA